MLLEAALLAVLVGFLLGGNFRRVPAIRLKCLPVLLIPVAVSLLTRMRLPLRLLAALGRPGAVALILLRYGMLVAFALINWREWSVGLMGLGGLLNGAVTLANGGAMPVSRLVLRAAAGSASTRLLAAGRVFGYRVADGSTRLRLLDDWIRARGFHAYLLSAGDVLIAVGVFILVLRLMGAQPPRRAFARFRR